MRGYGGVEGVMGRAAVEIRTCVVGDRAGAEGGGGVGRGRLRKGAR